MKKRTATTRRKPWRRSRGVADGTVPAVHRTAVSQISVHHRTAAGRLLTHALLTPTCHRVTSCDATETTRQSQTADSAPGVATWGVTLSTRHFLGLQCFDAVGWVAGRASGL